MLSIVHGCCHNFHPQDNPTSAYQAAFALEVQTASQHPALFVSSSHSCRSTWDHSQFLAPNGLAQVCINLIQKQIQCGCVSQIKHHPWDVETTNHPHIMHMYHSVLNRHYCCKRMQTRQLVCITKHEYALPNQYY